MRVVYRVLDDRKVRVKFSEYRFYGYFLLQRI